MEIVCTPGAVVKGNKSMKEMKQAGFQNVFFDLVSFCNEYTLENPGKVAENWDNYYYEFLPFHPDKVVEATEFYRSESQKQGMGVTIGRAPRTGRTYKHATDIDLQKTLMRESIKACGLAGAKFVIVSPLNRHLETEEDIALNREFFLSLTTLAREYNLQLLLPVDCAECEGHMVRNLASDPYFLCDFVDELNRAAGEERFGICLDTGVCNLLGLHIYEFITQLGSRIKAMILCENDGAREGFLVPYTAAMFGVSKMDWLNLYRGLRAIRFDGPIICDFHDTTNATPPFFKPVLLQYEKQIADYVAWQINIENVIRKHKQRVLFGAGNMCRNYMKNYGEEYPPLYTCDNNPATWGQTFEGLEIKNPQELKNLPADCAIYICNVYYNEIEKQLREMGIENPIERYNDEYLPSMYTDRYDGERRKLVK